jgi:DNA-binding MarR family transcriptional regulator
MRACEAETPDEAPLRGAVRVLEMAGSDEPVVPESRSSDGASADSDLSDADRSTGERPDPSDDGRMGAFDDRDAAAWFGFVESQRRVLEALDGFIKGAIGIAVEDFEVLTTLRVAPEGRLRMRDLGGRLCFSPSRLSHRIDRLHDLGFVDREPVPGDRRGTFARLTKLGAETVALASGLPRVVSGLRAGDHARAGDHTERHGP